VSRQPSITLIRPESMTAPEPSPRTVQPAVPRDCQTAYLASAVNSSCCIEVVRDLQRRLRPHAQVPEVERCMLRLPVPAPSGDARLVDPGLWRRAGRRPISAEVRYAEAGPDVVPVEGDREPSSP
jgi:hypothetical protein